jgi:hypothetical protein
VTILDILTKAGLSAAGIIALLHKASELAPDLAPEVNDLLAKLAAAVDQQSLVALAAALPAEIANIAKGNLDPKDHPGDLA